MEHVALCPVSLAVFPLVNRHLPPLCPPLFQGFAGRFLAFETQAPRSASKVWPRGSARQRTP